jgi:hypothetical protein
MKWWGNVIDKGSARGVELAGKGAVVGAVIGGGAALVGGVSIPAVGLAAYGGAKTGAKAGLGLGLLGCGVMEAYRTWNQ